jgi:hypothetical protein
MKLIDDIFPSIGAMKAGTSWLAKQIEDHPEIYITPVKEVHYFAHMHSPIKILDKNGRIEAIKTYVAWTNADIDMNKLKEDLAWFDSYLDDNINDAVLQSIQAARRQEVFYGIQQSHRDAGRRRLGPFENPLQEHKGCIQFTRSGQAVVEPHPFPCGGQWSLRFSARLEC